MKTGVYSYRIKLTSNYLNSAISSFIPGQVLVVNEQASPFGAGWGIEGLTKLHLNSDGTVVLTDGNGTALFFAGGPSTFSAPRGDFSVLVKNPDGTFTRTLKNGTKINFNAQGLQTSVVDRNGNTTSYGYDGSGRLTSIADPAGMVTTFTYAGNFLSSVTDPAGRKTAFNYDAAGNLTRVTFPNPSFRSFGYDSRNLMVSETNERGFIAQREYDSLGRLVKATLPDGSVRTATNAQTIGFADPSSGVGTITNPAPVARPADALSRYTDGKGNQQTVKIGKFGAPLRITDALGQTTLIERRSGNEAVLQNGATFAAGRVGQAFSFDGVDDYVRGNTTAGFPLGDSPRTITAWIRSPGPGGSDRGILHYGVQNANLPPTNFHLFVSRNGRGGVGNGFGHGVAFGTTFLDDDRFHFITGVYEGPVTNITRIYVDGVQEGSAVITTPGTPSGTFTIGRFLESDPHPPFKGLIDEVEIYNRALTASEIQALFTAGNIGNRITPPPGLVGWWQGEGNAVDSVSGDGLPTRITRPNGAVTTMSYDSRGNLSTSTDPMGALTAFGYEPAFNQVTSIRDPRGNTTNISYDAKGNPTEIRDALNNRTQMTYDSRGLLTSLTSGVGTAVQNTTSFTYDTRGNLLTTTDPRNNVTTLAYDNAGNVIRSTDAEGRVMEFAYDPMNRLVRVLDANVQQTNYAYDLKGNLTQVSDAKNQTTTFSYDQRDRLSSATNSLALSESFAYDANGNLTRTTNRNGQSITFNYDALNRLISKSRPPISTEMGLQVTTFGYDSVGNLTSVADPDSTVTNGYDLANRLTSTTASILSMPARTISYGYDLNRNRTAMTGPQGGLTNYVYDSLNRLTSLTNPSARTTSFTYDALGRRTSMTHATGIVTSYSYDAASQLTRLAHQLGATIINSFDYTYDKIGNRKTKVDRNGSYNYTYDTLSRLTQALNPLPSNPSESYTYDAVGNRTNSNQNGLSIFNQANQLTEDANFTHQYDNNGNLIRKAAKVGGAFTNYEYDAENKLVRVVNNGTTINYRYDGLGRRIEKEVIQAGSKLTRYVYDNEDILFELDGANNIVARYTHGPGIDEPLIMEKGGQNFFYHADGLGSITEISNATGSVVQRYTYSSFGKIESQLDANFVQPYTFTAREFDVEIGLYFYRARYYDPFVGRFLQEDLSLGSQLSPLSQNRYPYVANHPLRFTDPSGEILVNIGLGLIGAGISITYDLITGRPIDPVQAIASGITASVAVSSPAVQAGVGALIEFLQSLYEQLTDCKPGVSISELLSDTALGFLGGAVGPKYPKLPFDRLAKVKDPFNNAYLYEKLQKRLLDQQVGTVLYDFYTQGTQRALDYLAGPR